MTVCDDVQIKYTGDGTAVLFTFPFEYEKQSDVKVGFLNEDNGRYEEVAMTDANHPWSFENATTIRFTTAPTEEFKIYRNTTTQFAVFAPGSSIRAQDLNKNFDEIDMLVEEAKCGTQNAIDYIDENYWDKNADTLKSGEDWVGTDTKIATNLRNDERYLKLAGPGANITVEQEQLDGTVPDDDTHVLSNAASIERYDSILSTSDPGPQSQPGKIWQNTADETQNYWNDSIEAWVDNHKVGPVGPEGPQGPSGTVTVGQTTTSAPGGDAQVTNTGTATNAVLNFTIPRGEEGPVGPVGPQGPAGAGVTFQGNIDATQPNSAPADPVVGDLWVNTGNGNLDASWGIGTLPILQGFTLVWAANGIWNLQEPALAADLWEQNANGQIQPISNRQVFVSNQINYGGTPVNPALVVSGENTEVNTGLNVPVANTIGLRTGGDVRATVNNDGIQVGPAIELQGTNETIVVGNMLIDTNQINHNGQWSIDINNNDLMVFRDNDITTIEDLDVEGTAAPGFSLTTTIGRVYRIDAINAGDEAWWASVGAPNPQVGAYFTAIVDGAVPANNNITWIINTADLHVSGDTSIGGGLTVNNITFPDGSVLETGGASVAISDNPPADPNEGDLWWNSIEGELFIWYDDGTSEQWVQANGGSSVNLDEVIRVEEGAPTPSLDIDANGRLGIGVADPQRNLVVSGGVGDGVIQLTNNTSGTGFTEGLDIIHFVNGETDINNRQPASLRFSTDGTERMRLNEFGALGLDGTNFGDAGQVLTSQGAGAAPQWAAAAGSGSNHITITTAANSHVVTGIPPEANIIQFSFRSLDLDTSNTGLEMRFGNATGTPDTGNVYAWMARRLGGPELSDRNPTHNSMILVSSGHTVAANSSYVGVVTITRCGTDGYNCAWTMSAASGSATQIVGNGFYTNIGFPVESVTLMAQNGNITAGRMAVSWS